MSLNTIKKDLVNAGLTKEARKINTIIAQEDKTFITNLVEKNTSSIELYEYLVSPSGEWAGLYKDGTFRVGPDVGKEMNEDNLPLAMIRCPGIENVDSTFWTEGWTEYDRDSGEYIVTNASEHHPEGTKLSLEQCIEVVCVEGDASEVEAFVEDLQEKLIDAYHP